MRYRKCIWFWSIFFRIWSDFVNFYCISFAFHPFLQDFTTGINCETCLPGYYRPYGVPHTSNQPCRKCQCRESVGSTGICVEDDSRVDDGLVCIFYSWVLNSAGYLLQLGIKFSRVSFTVGYYIQQGIFYSRLLNSAGYILQLGIKFSRVSFTVVY